MIEEKIIDKGFGKGIKLSMNEFKGKKFFQIMEMWKTSPDDKEWKYSKKNFTVNAKTIEEFVKYFKDNGDEIIKELT